MTKIMVAEDDQTMVNLLTTLLKMEGFEVVALDPAEKVSAAVERDCPDILLLDVHLSHQNGLEILDTLQSSKIRRGMQVVMISGLNLKAECLRRGADDFLLKPFMPDDLICMLRKHIKPS